MNHDSLQKSLIEYAEQLRVIEEALIVNSNTTEKESLLELKRDLNQLVELTKQSLEGLTRKENDKTQPGDEQQVQIDDEYALFMGSATPNERLLMIENNHPHHLDENPSLILTISQHSRTYHLWPVPITYFTDNGLLLPYSFDRLSLFMCQKCVKVTTSCPFKQEMAKEGAYSDVPDKPGCSKDVTIDDVEIDDELASLLGMKCSVYHTHRWGGQPSLHNAMVSSIVAPQSDDQFKDLQVRVLFTHPTHTEMLPCPFFLDGECRFDDEKCRYSHGAVVPLSNLKDAIEPNFEGIREGTRVLLKLKPPDDEDISLTKKHTEKYHLWHRAIVKGVDLERRVCVVRVEHGLKSGDKRKAGTDETVPFENLFPLDTIENTLSESDESLSDTEYPESKAPRCAPVEDDKTLLIEKSLQSNGPAMGEWERHTKGIASKLMLAMGYVPGSGLGAAGEGRVAPVDARIVPKGTSLDHIMALSENGGQDSMKVEQRLKRLQKKEEDRNKRALEREKERERKNVFNFLNKTLGDKSEEGEAKNKNKVSDVKQSSSKDLNVESFKTLEDIKKVERDIIKLNSSLQRHQSGTQGHKNLNSQIVEKTKELGALKTKEQFISREQKLRKDKHKMTIF